MDRPFHSLLALDILVDGLCGALARTHGQNDRGRAGSGIAAGKNVGTGCAAMLIRLDTTLDRKSVV